MLLNAYHVLVLYQIVEHVLRRQMEVFHVQHVLQGISCIQDNVLVIIDHVNVIKNFFCDTFKQYYLYNS